LERYRRRIIQPLGIKPSRFPGKVDCHPPKGYCNWWEKEINSKSSKNKFKQIIEKEIKKEISDYANN
jgi:hypothetical protein